MARIDPETVRAALKVYFIMGSVDCGGKDPAAILSDAVAGGITMFQYREKGIGALTGEDRLALARRLQQICRAHRIPFIVNDDLELALELDADGMHVGQEDEAAAVIRARIGSGKIVGVSAHTVEEARKAIQDGADYLGIGPIFPTRSKADAKEASGTRLIERLREMGLAVPIVGIGGITPHNAASVLQAGADGVSVISAIAAAPSAREAAERFVEGALFR